MLTVTVFSVFGASSNCVKLTRATACPVLFFTSASVMMIVALLFCGLLIHFTLIRRVSGLEFSKATWLTEKSSGYPI